MSEFEEFLKLVEVESPSFRRAEFHGRGGDKINAGDMALFDFIEVAFNRGEVAECDGMDVGATVLTVPIASTHDFQRRNGKHISGNRQKRIQLVGIIGNIILVSIY